MVKKYQRIHLGDSGTSQVCFKDPKRLPKSHRIFDFFGVGDEYMAILNIALLQSSDDFIKDTIARLLDLGYRIMGQVSSCSSTSSQEALVTDKDLEYIQGVILKIDRSSELKEFIRYFKSPQAAYINLARAKVREWERVYHSLPKEFKDPLVAKILNRLSTLLFELALQAQKA